MTSLAIADMPAAVPLARIRGFHPGWFGAVMGTAIVGIVAYQNPGNLAALADAARAFGMDHRQCRHAASAEDGRDMAAMSALGQPRTP